ncbi:hypothetical protein OSB04_001685 [Centaurea solstitialis]|uniref:Uncharacterized protein n=1 Tax=Centaurea solstitialis TaxID=347529 RepID=A0AA38TT93_9ASTR|nr:hypothetical protein OSB04_001685 [Centaurea solstitialis]
MDSYCTSPIQSHSFFFQQQSSCDHRFPMMGNLLCLVQLDQSTIAIKETFGKFDDVLSQQYSIALKWLPSKTFGKLASWISIKHSVHAFEAMDASYERKSEIQAMLPKLKREMKVAKLKKDYTFDTKLVLFNLDGSLAPQREDSFCFWPLCNPGRNFELELFYHGATLTFAFQDSKMRDII